MSDMESLRDQTSTLGLSETPVTPAAADDAVQAPVAIPDTQASVPLDGDEPQPEQGKMEPNEEAAADDEPDRQQQTPPDTGGAPIKVFVGGLDPSWGITAEDLRKHFENFGAVQDVLIKAPSTASIRGQRGLTCAPRGYAFVSIRDPAVAKEIVSKVCPARPSETGSPSQRRD
jgi:RNA recognition motif-containing protein